MKQYALIALVVLFSSRIITAQEAEKPSLIDSTEVGIVVSVTDSSIIHKPGEPTENWRARHNSGRLDIRRQRGNLITFLALGLAPDDPKTMEFWLRWYDPFKMLKYFGLKKIFKDFNATFGNMNVEMTRETSTRIDSQLSISMSSVADSLGEKDWMLKVDTRKNIIELLAQISLGIQKGGKAREDSNSHRRAYFVGKLHLPREIILRAGFRKHPIDPLVVSAGISKQGRLEAEILRFNNIILNKNITQYYVLYLHPLYIQPLRGRLEIVGRYENIIGPNKRTMGIGWRYKNRKRDFRIMTTIISKTDGTWLLNTQLLIHVPIIP